MSWNHYGYPPPPPYYPPQAPVYIPNPPSTPSIDVLKEARKEAKRYQKDIDKAIKAAQDKGKEKKDEKKDPRGMSLLETFFAFVLASVVLGPLSIYLFSLSIEHFRAVIR